VSKYPGDDIIYSKATQNYNLVQWLIKRYYEWSGRLFPDAMSLILLENKVWLWRIINSLLITALAYGLVRIWKKKVCLIEFLLALSILGYFKENILSAGVFWITGSMNYLWPITLGLIAMLPYADKVFRNEEILNKWNFLLFLIIGFLASVGNEQVALCMTCFGFLSHIELFRQKKSQDKKLIFLTIIIVIGTSILLLAPGNNIRYIKEAAFWYPGFENLTIKDHFYIGTIWGFEKLFIDMKYLILLVSVITVIPYFKEQYLRKNIIFNVFFFILCMIFIFHITGFGLGSLYNFEVIKNFNFSSTLFSLSVFNRQFLFAIFPYLFWFVYSIMLIYLLLKNTKRKKFIIFCILAVTSTLVLMFFSPTIYGSGNRVLIVGSVILGIIIIGKIIEERLISTCFYFYIFGAFPIINLFNMLFKWLSNGFTPFL
jgi:hypothetical protein